MPLKLVKREGYDVWYVHGTVAGNRVRESTETENRKLAEEYKTTRETEIYKEARLGHRRSVPFVSAAVAFLEFEERSPATIARVDRLVQHFKSTRVDRVDQDAVDAACKILRPNPSAATRVREIYTPTIAILHFSEARKWCDAPAIKKPTVGKVDTRWLLPREALRLIDGAAPHLKPLLVFLLCTGARLSEALDLDWDDVDLPGKRVTFCDTKSGSDRIAALSPRAIEALANLPLPAKEKKRTGQVFRTDNGIAYADRNRAAGGQIKTGWKTACKGAALTGVTPHDLRHTWATYFYGLTKDLLLLADEGGWAGTLIVERYAHLMPKELLVEVRLVWGDSHPRIGALPKPRRKTDANLTQPKLKVVN